MIRMEIIGHLGRNATVRTVGTSQVIEFSVCHTEKWMDQQNQPQERAVWVTCEKWVAQGGSIKVAEFLTKGTQVFVAGTPEARGYKAKDPAPDGTEVIKGELKLKVFGELQLLGGGQQQAGPAGAAPTAQTAPPPPPQPVWNGTAWVIPPPTQPATSGGGDLPF